MFVLFGVCLFYVMFFVWFFMIYICTFMVLYIYIITVIKLPTPFNRRYDHYNIRGDRNNCKLAKIEGMKVWKT